MGNNPLFRRRWLATAGLLVLLTARLTVAERALTAFLPPHSTIILLPSISGDVESEETYHDQLQTWLELLEEAHKAIVFWEAPEAIALPSKPPAQVLKPSREEFLALGKGLAGQTNPLVVIAWGHGGMQGATPVFHVRGPRLAPGFQ